MNLSERISETVEVLEAALEVLTIIENNNNK
mgnify:CR=1 FL=1